MAASGSSSTKTRLKRAMQNPSDLSRVIREEKARLIQASLSDSTHKNYEAAINSFEKFRFRSGMEVTWPPTSDQLADYTLIQVSGATFFISVYFRAHLSFVADIEHMCISVVRQYHGNGILPGWL